MGGTGGEWSRLPPGTAAGAARPRWGVGRAARPEPRSCQGVAHQVAKAHDSLLGRPRPRDQSSAPWHREGDAPRLEHPSPPRAGPGPAGPTGPICCPPSRTPAPRNGNATATCWPFLPRARHLGPARSVERGAGRSVEDDHAGEGGQPGPAPAGPAAPCLPRPGERRDGAESPSPSPALPPTRAPNPHPDPRLGLPLRGLPTLGHDGLSLGLETVRGMHTSMGT